MAIAYCLKGLQDTTIQELGVSYHILGIYWPYDPLKNRKHAWDYKSDKESMAGKLTGPRGKLTNIFYIHIVSNYPPNI